MKDILDGYYNSQKNHTYMDIENYDQVVFDFLSNEDLANKTVLELGAGYGRYTEALSQLANKVFAVEPNPHMFKGLQQNFDSYEKVTVLKNDLKGLLESGLSEQIDKVYLFHVLHHLPQELFSKLKLLVEKYNSVLEIVEPNHRNPLFFLQVLLTSEMSFVEEEGMFSDNTDYLIREFLGENYRYERKYLGLFPPRVTDWLRGFGDWVTNSKLLSTSRNFPWMVYSVCRVSPVAAGDGSRS